MPRRASCVAAPTAAIRSRPRRMHTQRRRGAARVPRMVHRGLDGVDAEQTLWVLVREGSAPIRAMLFALADAVELELRQRRT